MNKKIIYWVSAFGLLISACAFFNYSSPKQSIRKGTFSLIQILLNCLYIWSYKFSGATEVRFEIVFQITGLGYIAVNVQNMVMLYMGIYFLPALLQLREKEGNYKLFIFKNINYYKEHEFEWWSDANIIWQSFNNI